MWFKQGQIEVESRIGCDCGNVECGDKGRDGIECGERVYGDESGECGFRGE